MPALNFLLTPEQFAELGIDPDPNTALNTLSWGRLIQLAEATGLGIRLEAENNVTFEAFNGTVSTAGSPTGAPGGWTITLALPNPVSVRANDNAFTVISRHGDIIFEDQSNNLAVLGGTMNFSADEGELHLGNLYGLGPSEPIDVLTSWNASNISLSADGNIEVGSINTRNQPARFTDPLTGAPLPQTVLTDDYDLVIPAGPIDFDDLDPEVLFSDLFRGGSVEITSDNGDIDILGPVYTGTNAFSATALNGEFTAGVIDTGANRLLVKRSNIDPGRISTLHTGDVDISARKITFEQINAGQVDLEAIAYAEDAITGNVIIDNFFVLDVLRSTRALPDGGMDLRVGPETGVVLSPCGFSDCIDNLRFDWVEVGEAVALNLNSGPQLKAADLALDLDGSVEQNLGPGFTFEGGRETILRDTPPPLAAASAVLTLNPPLPGVVPIQVPLNLDSGEGAPGPVPTAVAFGGGNSFGGGSAPPVSGPGPTPPAPGSDTAVTVGLSVFDSVEDSTQVDDEGDGSPEDTVEEENEEREQKAKRDDNQLKDEECPDTGLLAWLRSGPRSTAGGVDFGRRSGIGTAPAAGNTPQPDRCPPNTEHVVNAGRVE